MTGFQIPHVGEGDQLIEVVRRAARDRLQEVADVVAEVVAVEHLTHEPARRIVEYRQVIRAGMPRTTCELVRLVAGLAAEQPGQVALGPRKQVHGQV